MPLGNGAVSVVRSQFTFTKTYWLLFPAVSMLHLQQKKGKGTKEKERKNDQFEFGREKPKKKKQSIDLKIAPKRCGETDRCEICRPNERWLAPPQHGRGRACWGRYFEVWSVEGESAAIYQTLTGTVF